MDFWRIIQALVSVVGISVGQLLLKRAAVNLGNPEAIGFWFLGLRINVYLFLGVSLLGVATLMWMSVLRHVPLSLAYPIMALAFFLVPLLSFAFLGEPLDWKILAGGALIGLGLIVIYS